MCQIYVSSAFSVRLPFNARWGEAGRVATSSFSSFFRLGRGLRLWLNDLVSRRAGKMQSGWPSPRVLRFQKPEPPGVVGNECR